jgi:UDP-N-acetylglucosamine diphosphorylase / glucose-1-phosphate thymidylyltransferase / UDP-N-acetylgalactosamine diphosphorylase / glucosamine-1-phosphate N-acetyltransferase / galactosamine-1-phosphate N-acetyltransferase
MPVWWRELQAQEREFGALLTDPHVADVHPSAFVSDSATLDTSRGAIFVGARSRICDGAYVQGPVAIGADCLIGNLAMIRGSTSIGGGTRIGFAAEIKNAIIEDDVTIGPQCFVADSKIEREAYLGAQVRTSNHRLDKDSVKVLVEGEWVDTGMEKLGCLIGAGSSLGIQVIVLPGRMIAPGSSFAPRITVEKNLPPGRYRLAQQLECF